MQAKLATSNDNLLVGRIRNAHDLFALIPREIEHFLFVLDPADDSEHALAIALEVAERWGPQITLVHGGKLSGWGEAEVQPGETALMDLLCLSWQIRGAYPDVSISRTLPASLSEVLEEAVKRQADLIMLPEPLAARFCHSELTMSVSRDGTPVCPIVVIEPVSAGWGSEV